MTRNKCAKNVRVEFFRNLFVAETRILQMRVSLPLSSSALAYCRMVSEIQTRNKHVTTIFAFFSLRARLVDKRKRLPDLFTLGGRLTLFLQLCERRLM